MLKKIFIILTVALTIPSLSLAAERAGYIGFDPWALVAETLNAADGETIMSWNGAGLLTGGRTGINLVGGLALAPGWYIEMQAASSFANPDWQGSAALGLAWLPLESFSTHHGGPIVGVQATGLAWLYPDGYRALFFVPVAFGGYRIPASECMAVDLRLNCGGVEYAAFAPRNADTRPDGWSIGVWTGFSLGATLIWTF